MGIQNSINSLLGTAATIAEVANISKGIKAGNALKEEEITSNLQGRELDVHGAILQDETGIQNNKDEIANLKQQLEDVQFEKKSRRSWSPDKWNDFKRKEKSIGFNIQMREESKRNLEGQLAGKQAQLADIRARMERMHVQSLLPKQEPKPEPKKEPKGGNE